MRTDDNGGRRYLVYFHTKLLDFRCAYALCALNLFLSISFFLFLSLSLSRVKLVPLHFRGKTPREKFVLTVYFCLSLNHILQRARV
jgi:hypothetical protein